MTLRATANSENDFKWFLQDTDIIDYVLHSSAPI